MSKKNISRYYTMLEQKNTTWTSCCLTCDKSAMKYIIQIVAISGLFVTSVVMLITDPDCISQRSWGSLLTLCIGILCPSPSMSS